MTISFLCPNCRSICGFRDKHAGRSARCTKCNQRFVIPSKSGETAEKIKPVKPKAEPFPGFYKAVFLKNFPVIFSRKNLVPLLTVVAFQYLSLIHI